MKEKTSQILFDYWNEVRGDRIAPRRFEIEPSRIASILPETFILEREARHQHRFRLAGTKVCEQFGREFRGMNILDLFTGIDREPVDRVLETVTAEGAVGVISLDAIEKQGRKVTLELLLLPLVHTGETVTRILGSIATNYPASWLGHQPIGRIEGPVTRSFNGGFAIGIQATVHRREKLAAQLTWLINRDLLGAPETRRHDRAAPPVENSHLVLPNGTQVQCKVLDISISGASVFVAQPIETGTEVTLGRLRAKVVRQHDQGIGLQFIDIQNPVALRRHFG